MKNRDYKKNMSQYQHTKQPQSKPQEENLETSRILFEDSEYLVSRDNYSATVKRAGEDNILGLFKAATRTWKIDDLPMFIKDAVESLYC